MVQTGYIGDKRTGGERQDRCRIMQQDANRAASMLAVIPADKSSDPVLGSLDINERQPRVLRRVFERPKQRWWSCNANARVSSYQPQVRWARRAPHASQRRGLADQVDLLPPSRSEPQYECDRE